ncbi:SDR family oxidoreductase [Leifsonia aquatica]|uniref:SDR family oxidoreductase n=1 Tax=Leifsonia aquatica TaxID=144185 RepID=UPI00382776CF
MVLLSSLSIRYGVAGQTNYAASKGAIEAFARALAKEHAAHGIRVNVIAPGATDTDMIAAMPDAEREEMIRQIPLGRLGMAGEVADVIVDISESTYVTAAVVAVAGGL